MVRLTASAALALALAAAGGANATEALPWDALETTSLAGHSGGPDYIDASAVIQGNASDTNGSNHHNQINNGAGGSMENGAITATTISGNSGITAAMQNTGNLVNMNYSMNVNVYLK